MSNLDVAPPSDEEVAAAEAVMARLAAANAARVDAVLPDLRAMIAQPMFADTLAAAAGLRDRLPAGTPFHSHLGAMLVGMTNLQNDVALL